MCYTNFEIWPYRGCAGSVENPPLGPCMGGEKGKIDTKKTTKLFSGIPLGLNDFF